MGTGAVTSVSSTDNGNITLPSAKTRMIQSVGVPVVTGTRNTTSCWTRWRKEEM